MFDNYSDKCVIYVLLQLKGGNFRKLDYDINNKDILLLKNWIIDYDKNVERLIIRALRINLSNMKNAQKIWNNVYNVEFLTVDMFDYIVDNIDVFNWTDNEISEIEKKVKDLEWILLTAIDEYVDEIKNLSENEIDSYILFGKNFFQSDI